MMITSKGQVTIPKEIRDACGLQPHTEVEFSLVEGILTLKPAISSQSRGVNIVEHLEHYAKYRNDLTADEIMAMTRGED